MKLLLDTCHGADRTREDFLGRFLRHGVTVDDVVWFICPCKRTEVPVDVFLKSANVAHLLAGTPFNDPDLLRVIGDHRPYVHSMLLLEQGEDACPKLEAASEMVFVVNGPRWKLVKNRVGALMEWGTAIDPRRAVKEWWGAGVGLSPREQIEIGPTTGLIALVWNVAHPQAEYVQERVRALVDRGVQEHCVIAWCPDGESPRVTVDHFTKESRVPRALEHTLFMDAGWWMGIVEHATANGLLMLRNRLPVGPVIDQKVDSIWMAEWDGTIRNTKCCNGPLMAPYVKGEKP